MRTSKLNPGWYDNHDNFIGQYNPGGKLTMTWLKTTGQIEFNFPFKSGSHANQSSNEDPNGFGKTSVNGPLYPFGFGLSYTTFQYSNLMVIPFSFIQCGCEDTTAGSCC